LYDRYGDLFYFIRAVASSSGHGHNVQSLVVWQS
jgi:hypothetical protein